MVVPTYPDGEAVSPIVRSKTVETTDNGREEEKSKNSAHLTLVMKNSVKMRRVKYETQCRTSRSADPSILEKSGDAPLSSLTQEVYSRLCDWMRVIRAKDKVEGLCQRVLEAFALLEEELLNY